MFLEWLIAILLFVGICLGFYLLHLVNVYFEAKTWAKGVSSGRRKKH